jgi:Phosphoenolpyruvate phosphomutase
MVNVALAFREMHQNSTPLRLPNAWDAGSARTFKDLGAPAIETTSAGVNWAFGYPDGNVLPVRLLAELTANIVRVIRIPLSVDVEAGYTHNPANVGEVLKPVLAAGPVGINIEDGKDAPEMLTTKIESIRKSAAQLGVGLFINARTDVYLHELVPKERRVEETYSTRLPLPERRRGRSLRSSAGEAERDHHDRAGSSNAAPCPRLAGPAESGRARRVGRSPLERRVGHSSSTVAACGGARASLSRNR